MPPKQEHLSRQNTFVLHLLCANRSMRLISGNGSCLRRGLLLACTIQTMIFLLHTLLIPALPVAGDCLWHRSAGRSESCASLFRLQGRQQSYVIMPCNSQALMLIQHEPQIEAREVLQSLCKLMLLVVKKQSFLKSRTPASTCREPKAANPHKSNALCLR